MASPRVFETKWFSLTGFAKGDRANIDAGEEKQFKEMARRVPQLKEEQI